MVRSVDDRSNQCWREEATIRVTMVVMRMDGDQEDWSHLCVRTKSNSKLD